MFGFFGFFASCTSELEEVVTKPKGDPPAMDPETRRLVEGEETPESPFKLHQVLTGEYPKGPPSELHKLLTGEA